MKRTKKPSVSLEFLDALADVIADRVATKLSEASKSPPQPREVPLWVPGPKGRRTKPALPAGRKWTPEVALREAGMLTIGDPGYKEALGPYLERIRAYEGKRAHKGRLRQMVRLLDELLAPTRQAPHEAVPAGMTVWVKADDVARAIGCSQSKAHEYLRAAAGRSIGTGQLLRVPVDVWEAWATDNLIDGLRHERRETGRTSRSESQATAATVSTTSASASPRPARRRNLTPLSHVESKLPLIPLLVPAKR